MQVARFLRKKYIVRLEMFVRIYLSYLFRNQKNVRGSKLWKTEKWCFGTALDQWNERVNPSSTDEILFFFALSASYAAWNNITTLHKLYNSVQNIATK